MTVSEIKIESYGVSQYNLHLKNFVSVVLSGCSLIKICLDDQRVFGEVCRRFITIGVVVGGMECVLGI